LTHKVCSSCGRAIDPETKCAVCGRPLCHYDIRSFQGRDLCPDCYAELTYQYRSKECDIKP